MRRPTRHAQRHRPVSLNPSAALVRTVPYGGGTQIRQRNGFGAFSYSNIRAGTDMFMQNMAFSVLGMILAGAVTVMLWCPAVLEEIWRSEK